MLKPRRCSSNPRRAYHSQWSLSHFKSAAVVVAPRQRFELRFTAPKAAVLPLDDRGIAEQVRGRQGKGNHCLPVYPTIPEILAGAVQERPFHSKFCTAWCRFDNLNQMASLQRPGEITYYEELGVENTASADEIRDAFRALARLLHPDQQTDPQLKEIAERQMRKLNRVYGVLSDVSRRAAYDESLRASRNAPIIVFSGSDGSVKKLLVAFGAAGSIVVANLLLIWFAASGNNNTEVRGQELRGTTSGKTSDGTDGDAGEQITRLREQLRDDGNGARFSAGSTGANCREADGRRCRCRSGQKRRGCVAVRRRRRLHRDRDE